MHTDVVVCIGGGRRWNLTATGPQGQGEGDEGEALHHKLGTTNRPQGSRTGGIAAQSHCARGAELGVGDVGMLASMAEHKVVALERAKPEPSVPHGATLGWLVRVDDDGIWVDTEDNASGPLLALSVVSLSREELEAAISDRTEAVLLSVAGTGQPVLLGLRQPLPTLEAELPSPSTNEDLAATVDGKRVHLEGKDEVVLRCGKASITMRRNGRIVIRGVQVESRATGRNRIKGGAVLIN